MTRRVLGVMLASLLAGAPSWAGPPPWARTETREPCADFDPLRRPFFGDTHVHTTYSADAIIGDVRALPRDAYRFAQGEPLGLPPFDATGNPTRTAQLRRPLDFTAVTDHAEHFGELVICLTPGLPGYDSSTCTLLRNGIGQAQPGLVPIPATIFFFAPYTALPNPVRFGFCGPGGVDCLTQASPVWQDTQDAAEEFYDRTAACTFTTFVGYEWTGTTNVENLHRNVIFRNAVVPPLPISYLEEHTPQGLWTALAAQCLDAGTGCDALVIPHNSNVSRGTMFLPPATAGAAAFRAAAEPLVEITQHKGDSECRPGVLTNDELCGFEKMNRALLAGASDPNQTFAPLAFVRNALKEGLVQEETLGVNPFRLGLLGSTDTHNATPGMVREDDYRTAGHLGVADATPAFQLSPFPQGGIEANPGGLAVVWAEENSRDALFAAMRRREVYGTSGTRPLVRLFAGRLRANLCGDPDFVAHGYERGVPMGGELGAVRRRASPRFAVLALRDPGPPGLPGTPLQRVQIVKGWVNASGEAEEQVFEVAGDPANGAGVDLATCTPTGTGFDTLCAVWEDPEFDPARRAFYYARVVENPTCRWSTRLCNDLAVDCAGSVPAALAKCCDPIVPKTIQERAWTSPVWYRPEGIGHLRGRVRFGNGSGRDVLSLDVRMHRLSPEFDPSARDLVVALADDDEFFHATIPAGAMVERAAGRRWVLRDRTGAHGGVREAILKVRGGGEARLRLRTVRMDLAGAAGTDHTVDTTLAIGTYTATHTRRWQATGDVLRTR